jgi:hypothetical protein
LSLFAFCAAIGFVAAAAISSFYQWVTSEGADFSVERKSTPGIIVAIVISMFAGPFILVQKVIAGVRTQQLRALPAALAVVLSGMWSVCAGVFYISLLVSS